MFRTRLFLVVASSSLACVVSTEPPPGVGQRQGTAPAKEAGSPAAAPAESVRPAAPPAEPAARARPEPGERPMRPLPAAAAGKPAEIAVASAGEAPGRSLRTSAAAGTQQRLTVTVSGKMEFHADGKKLTDAALAPITATWLAKVDSVAPDGSRTVSLSIESATYDEAHPDARTVKATARAVEILGRVRAGFVLDPSGTPGPLEMQVDPRALNDMRPAVESVLEVVPLLFVPAPEAALGTGAKWTAASTISFAEMSLSQAAEYGVKTQRGEDTELTVKLDGKMPSPSAVTPGSRQIKTHEAQAEGTVTLAAGKLLPVAIDAKVHAEQTSDAAADSGPMSAKVVLELRIATPAAG
jgi:hypothetical protein